LVQQQGKVVIGVLGKFFYRPKSPSTSGTTCQKSPSTKSKILVEFITDLT
jgi:hypothetical protein